MHMTMIRRLALAAALALAATGCNVGKDNHAAYQVCMATANKDPKYAKAAFATEENSNIQASTGDADIRVNIPYEMDGTKGLYQCIASKQPDGTYKVTF